MPSSTALRVSRVRDLRRENHKRTHILESGLHLKDRDDDLTLFNDLQKRKKDNFLLQPADDFDYSLSRTLRYFSNIKVGFSVPVRGESGDLLDADGEKMDYDWLLTPPETPLFSSLDDEIPPINLVHGARHRSQLFSISRTGKAEKSDGTRKTCRSPCQFSPPCRSSNSTVQSGGRPSSATRSSTIPALRSTALSRRLSSPDKPSALNRISSTPTVQQRRMQSNARLSPTIGKGSSPGRLIRGNSASPKLREWQSTLPGFSLESPPNLQTSLSDRPAGRVRGSPPSSRNVKDLSTQVRSQSMSPTTRSARSSYSSDRDYFSSRSKGSVSPSGNDDMDSPQFVTVGRSHHQNAGKTVASPNSRALQFYDKPSGSLSSSSAPKRSFRSARQQMDQHKRPQNMFAPLLSSVPSSTFYVGKANTAQPKKYSVTTRGITSSDHRDILVYDTEDSNHDQDDLARECTRAPGPDAKGELSVFDEIEDRSKDIGHELGSGRCCNGYDSTTSELKTRTSELLNGSCQEEAIAADGVADADHPEMMPSCSICGSKSLLVISMDGSSDVCADCAEKGGLLTPVVPEPACFVTQNSKVHPEMALQENKFCDASEPRIGVSELLKEVSGKDTHGQQETNVEQGCGCLLDSCHVKPMMTKGEHLRDQQLLDHQAISCNLFKHDTTEKQSQHFNGCSDLQVDSSETAGISVTPLKRSSSTKLPVVQGRASTAANTPCDDFSYARDYSNTARSSTGQGRVSASSSFDSGLSRQTEACVQHKSGNRKAELGNSRDDFDAKPLRQRSSFSGISNNAYEATVLAKQTSEADYDNSIRNQAHKSILETPVASEGPLEHTGTTRRYAAGYEEGKSNCFSRMDATTLELPNIQLEDNSAADSVNYEGHVPTDDVDDLLPGSGRSISDKQVSLLAAKSSVIEDDVMLLNSVCGADVSDAATGSSSIMILELQRGNDRGTGFESGGASFPNSRDVVEALQEASVSTTSEEDVLVSSPDIDLLGSTDGSNEGSIETVDSPRGNNSKSLALEEATDTIFFCSSLIHSPLQDATTITMEKEAVVSLKGGHPTVTILGQCDSNRKDLHLSEHTQQNQKASQRQLGADVNIPSTNTENNENIQEHLLCDSAAPNKVISVKPRKLESKCNCTVM